MPLMLPVPMMPTFTGDAVMASVLICSLERVAGAAMVRRAPPFVNRLGCAPLAAGLRPTPCLLRGCAPRALLAAGLRPTPCLLRGCAPRALLAAGLRPTRPAGPADAGQFAGASPRRPRQGASPPTDYPQI